MWVGLKVHTQKSVCTQNKLHECSSLPVLHLESSDLTMVSMIKLALLLTTIAVTAGATCPPLAIVNDSHAPFYWVHVPKTGSSFAATIEAVCCGTYHTLQAWFGAKNLSEWPCMNTCAHSNKHARLGAHAPIGRGQETLIEDEDCFFSSHAVIMNLRRPKARLASGFFHHFHSCHEMQEESNGHLLGQLNLTGSYRDKIVALLKIIIANDTRLETDLRRYVDCVRGCSVKMVSGRTCGSNVSNSTHRFPQHLIDGALRRIERFSFVGFQEHWEASVKKFLAKFGGALSMELSLIHI